MAFKTLLKEIEDKFNDVKEQTKSKLVYPEIPSFSSETESSIEKKQ